MAPYNNSHIADKVVVITDEDPEVRGDRKQKLERCAEYHNASDKLSVHISNITLEYSLFTESNEPILKKAFLDIHPRSETKWDENVSGNSIDEKAKGFLSLFDSTNKTKKGDYAQALADQVENLEPEDGEFEIPQYLQDALSALVE